MDRDQQLRLQRFWGTTVFTLGVLWGFANLVYCPVAALTSIVGSSWWEVFVIALGGALSFCASIGAFFHRRLASRFLVAGGIALFLLAIVGQMSFHDHAHGPANLLLLFLAGAVAFGLGIFGGVTELKGWPGLRESVGSDR